ncbi:MAG: oligosaccharide flippase family protein [Prevotella sp.]|nr:oligosaccharide flippase family protein [Prevotella sp.]
MNSRGKAAYRNIMHSTMFFGGTQVLVTLVNLVKGKLVAVILGAAGMGLSSLLMSASGVIQQIASLGINNACVPEVSQANTAGDRAALLVISRIVRAMMLISAFAGMALAVLLSPLTARLSVGNLTYLGSFALLGGVVFFNILGSGEYALLQATRQYRSIAASTVVIPVCSLLIGIPVYYVWGMAGIAPVLVVQSLVYYLSVRWLAARSGLGGQRLPRVPLRTVWSRGRGIIMLGMTMMVAALLGNVTVYGLSAFISNTGSMTDVGFYQAAVGITAQCSGLVFSAMATDYYPKLAGIVHTDPAGAYRLVNRQIEIVLLIITPIAMLIILAVPFIISLLLTSEYQVIRLMLRFMGFSVIFKALCFPMDYISFSRGDKKYFFWLEGVFLNIKMFAVFALFYHFLGLDGLGYAALCSSAIDVAVSIVMNRWRYGFRMSRVSTAIFIRLTAIAAVCFAASFIASPALSYGLMGASTILCCIYSYRQIDRRIGIREVAVALKNRLK